MSISFLVLLSVVPSRSSEHPGTSGQGHETSSDAAAYWGFDLVVLLNEAPVRADLSISRDQILRHGQLVERYLNSLQSLLVSAKQTQTLPKAERDVALAELGRRQHALTRNFGKHATAILTPPQRSRLKEITFQLRGVDAFFTEEMGKLIPFDDRQRGEIDEARDWLIVEIQRLRRAGRASATDRQTDAVRLSRLRQEAQRRIYEVLTDDQRDQLKRLRGRPIAFSRADLSMLLRQRGNAANTAAERP